MQRKWGLALGAGGFHGIAHLGVLRTLTDEGFFPDLIAGTSAGALAAGLYASGVDLGRAADTIASMNTPQMLDFSGGLRSMVPGLILSRMGIIQGDLVEQALEKMTEGRKLAEANPPVAIEAVDLSSG
ncbi:MAG TPA: patatin family protein, partial [Firmicutes bacterium]|nr:patatin family protein [Bacillota bacterium]